MSTFPKYFYNGIDLILIPGKNFSKNNLINHLKKMNIKVNNNKYSKGNLIKIYDNSLKEEKNIEKILDILISDTNNELKINLSPSNFKRKKGNVYQNMDNNNNINGNEQNLNQKNINGSFPIDNNNNNLINKEKIFEEESNILSSSKNLYIQKTNFSSTNTEQIYALNKKLYSTEKKNKNNKKNKVEQNNINQICSLLKNVNLNSS